jgi:UDP-N-acetylmuramate dehydrogenase
MAERTARSAMEPGRLEAAEGILRAACGERVHRSFALAPLTTFRVGGMAALYLEVNADADLAAASEALMLTGIPWFVLGKGSNVLVSDHGFDGLVVRLGPGYRWASRDGASLHAGAAMPLPALSGVGLFHGLAGLEFGATIPGSVGGAVRMNAGTREGSMSDVLESIDLFALTEGGRRRLPAADARLAYRRSRLPAGSVVVGATVSLRPGDPTSIRRAMDESRTYRRATQPLAEPNCGSVFKNPPGDHAARLIDSVGGKGLAVGGAVVSTKHANFIVTRAGATGDDVRRLIRVMQARVREGAGIELEPEVEFVGDFDVASI